MDENSLASKFRNVEVSDKRSPGSGARSLTSALNTQTPSAKPLIDLNFDVQFSPPPSAGIHRAAAAPDSASTFLLSPRKQEQSLLISPTVSATFVLSPRSNPTQHAQADSFLWGDSASPPSAKRNKESLSETAGLVGVALDSMGSDRGRTAHVQLNCIKTLRTLCNNDANNVSHISLHHGVELIVSAMRNLATNAEVQENACALLGEMCDCSTQPQRKGHALLAIRHIVDAGAVSDIISAVRAFAESAEIAETGVFTLGTICLQNLDENGPSDYEREQEHPASVPAALSLLSNRVSKDLCSRGALELLVTVMKHWKHEIKNQKFIAALHANCLAIIEKLVLPDKRAKMVVVEAGGVPVIVNNIERYTGKIAGGHREIWLDTGRSSGKKAHNRGAAMSRTISLSSATVQTVSSVTAQEQLVFTEQAIRALCAISMDCKEGAEHIGEMGGVEAVVSAMRHYNAQNIILSEGCVTLRYLAFSERNRARMVSCNAVDIIKQSLVRLQIEPLPTLNALLALSNAIYMCPKNEALAVESGCVEVISGVMSLHRANSEVQEIGCRVYQNLAFHMAQSKKGSVRTTMLDSLRGAMVAFPESRGVQFHGCAALVNLSEIYTKDLLNHDLDAHLQGVVRRYANDREIEEHASILLSRISEEKLNKSQKSKMSIITRAITGRSTSSNPHGLRADPMYSRSRTTDQQPFVHPGNAPFLHGNQEE